MINIANTHQERTGLYGMIKMSETSKLMRILYHMSLVVRKPVFWVFDLFPHKPGCTAIDDTVARGLKFRIYEEEGVYYPCSENKGADQLRGYRKAGLRLCFRICKKPVFSRRGSYYIHGVF